MSEENSELTRKLVNDQLKKSNEKTLEKYIDKKFNELGETLSNNLKDNNKTKQHEHTPMQQGDENTIHLSEPLLNTPNLSGIQ